MTRIVNYVQHARQNTRTALSTFCRYHFGEHKVSTLQRFQDVLLCIRHTIYNNFRICGISKSIRTHTRINTFLKIGAPFLVALETRSYCKIEQFWPCSTRRVRSNHFKFYETFSHHQRCLSQADEFWSRHPKNPEKNIFRINDFSNNKQKINGWERGG